MKTYINNVATLKADFPVHTPKNKIFVNFDKRKFKKFITKQLSKLCDGCEFNQINCDSDNSCTKFCDKFLEVRDNIIDYFDN